MTYTSNKPAAQLHREILHDMTRLYGLCEEIILLRERVVELEADAETWDQALRSVVTKLSVLGNA